MSDVSERTAVDECRSSFQSLNQVRFQSIFQKCCHSALCVDLSSCDRLTCTVVSNNDSSETLFQVIQSCSQAECCHNFRCNGDIKTIFSCVAVCFSAKSVNNVTKLSVVHIYAASPDDTSWIDIQCIALIDMVVDHCSQ